MRLLFLGDVVGRAARTTLCSEISELKVQLNVDFTVVNAENTTNGMGLSNAHAAEILSAGVDVITLGDHAFDQKEMLQGVAKEPRILRPINFANSAPGVGCRVFDAPMGKKVMVVQVLGQVFMKRAFSDPFSAVEAALKTARMGVVVDAIIVEIHAEATSEKVAMGHYCDGKVSLVVGTHTHIPTSDTQILPKGTAYQTDAGMCGDYQGVIGMDKTEPLNRFITGMPKARFTPAEGPVTLSGVLVDTDNKTGLARSVCAIRYGGAIAQTDLGV